MEEVGERMEEVGRGKGGREAEEEEERAREGERTTACLKGCEHCSLCVCAGVCSPPGHQKIEYHHLLV